MSTVLSAGIGIGFGVLALIVIVALMQSMVFLTGQETMRIVETFGRFTRVTSPGLHFKLPIPIQEVGPEISLQIREIVVDAGGMTKDKAFMLVPIRAQYRVDETRVREAYYKLSNPAKQIESYLVNQVRSLISDKTLDELYASKDSIEIDVKSVLAERMTEFGYVIENVLVDDPQPSEKMREAFEHVLVSERMKLAAKNEGEAAKIRSVAAATAEAEALELRGKALVKFRQTIADGNAKAIDTFTAGTGLSASHALDFIVNINEMEALTRIGEAGGKVVFMGASARSADLPVTAGLYTEG